MSSSWIYRYPCTRHLQENENILWSDVSLRYQFMIFMDVQFNIIHMSVFRTVPSKSIRILATVSCQGLHPIKNGFFQLCHARSCFLSRMDSSNFVIGVVLSRMHSVYMTILFSEVQFTSFVSRKVPINAEKRHLGCQVWGWFQEL
jgi:hypothetical protein